LIEALALTLLSVSLVAGFLGALVGIGGGVIIVPVLSTILHVPIKETVAASLVCVIATSIASSSRYIPKGLVNVRLALFLEVAAAVGASIGAFTAAYAPSPALHISLGLVLVVLSLLQFKGIRLEDEMLRRGVFSEVVEDRLAKEFKLSSEYYDERFKVKVKYNVTKSSHGLAASWAAGLMSGFLGLGGGSFNVPLMNKLMKVPVKVAVATSQIMVGLTASIGASVFMSLGLLDPFMIAPMVIGVALGSTLGALVMNKLRASAIKAVFGLLLACLAYLSFSRGLALLLGVALPGV